jgi:hypothetical protein
MNGWRPTTWCLLIWALLFPLGWTLLLANSTSDDGEPHRILDLIFWGLVGAAIWVTGLATGSIIWVLDHWFANRGRRSVAHPSMPAQVEADPPIVDWPR